MRTAREAHIDPTDGVPKHELTRETRRLRWRSVAPSLDHRNVPHSVPNRFRLACNWIAPWSVFSYPGHVRIILAVLGRSITDSAVGRWKRDDPGAPVWAATAIRDYIRHRCEVGLGLVDHLNAYIDERERAVELKHQRGRLRNHRPADE